MKKSGEGEIDVVSIIGSRVMRKYAFWRKLFVIFSIWVALFDLISLIVFPLALKIFFLIFTFGIFSFYWKHHRRFLRDQHIIERVTLAKGLRYFIVTNALYTSDVDSVELGFRLNDEKLVVYGFKAGDGYTQRMGELDSELSAYLSMELSEKINRVDVCEYVFRIRKPKRLVVAGDAGRTNALEIDLGYGVVYDPSCCPHILVAGGTGSGKSVLISFLILELLRRNCEIFVADPKNSDLGSLSHYLGEEHVATSPNNIARVVRLAVEAMQKRYAIMQEPDRFIYGGNFVDHGFNPIYVIFDEMGAFQASGTDKVSKAVVSEVMDGIKQIVLLGRQAGVFILIAAQQMNANTLNTDLRDNLGLRIALGANSSEGYRMVFGSATPESIPPIEKKGAGLLYIQSSGKESASYYESPFFDTKNLDFIAELKKYI